MLGVLGVGDTRRLHFFSVQSSIKQPLGKQQSVTVLCASISQYGVSA